MDVEVVLVRIVHQRREIDVEEEKVEDHVSVVVAESFQAWEEMENEVVVD